MSNQLLIVLDMEKRKEEKTLIDFQQANQAYQSQRQRLNGLFQYRQDYLQKIHQRGQQGIAYNTFGHLQSFVATLDTAEQKQQHQVAQAKAVLAQRQERWIRQQQRRKAIEHLIEKQRKQAVEVANRLEQRESDERALQQFMQQRDRALA